MDSCRFIGGGVTAPKGFLASGVMAGIKKKNRLDMAMLFSTSPAIAAGVFTSNRINGAHIGLCRERIGGGVRAVVVNSGNANACRGPQGRRDAKTMSRETASALGVPERSVMVCSTGTIGIPMPMNRISRGIRLAAEALSANGGSLAARAIMTTDTRDKQYAVELPVDGRRVRIGGMAKGSGMIEPNMATMLCFLTTDAVVKQAELQKCLRDAVDRSFNRISIDGDQSCNDTVLFLAGGHAGNRPLGRGHRDWKAFAAAVDAVTLCLAKAIVKDGEGATKFVTVNVRGAASQEDAKKVARAVSNSLLVKTSWFGGDPNWGRIIDAAGYSGAMVEESRINIAYNDTLAVRGGRIAPHFALRALEKIIAGKEFSVNIDLRLGRGDCTMYTCDCSEEYVRINSEYMT